MKWFSRLILIVTCLLAACNNSASISQSSTKPTPLTLLNIQTPASPVAPVIGLPSGTDGYAWWNDTVFYEVFVRSFYDSNGDGIGDLNGLIAKLPYLQELGVTGLWLMPIHPASSYHGYDVIDYYDIHPDFGTLGDFKRLLAEAHQCGMRVIIDLALNHTSDQNSWFVSAQDPKSPYRDWYVWSKTDPGQPHWYATASGYYYGFFQNGMPDLNYTNPDVTAKLQDIVRFWSQDIGVDGFRLDAAKYLIEEGNDIQNTDSTHIWYQAFRPFYKKLNPQAMTIGEVWDITPTAADYSQGDQLDLTFDFTLAQAFITSLRVGTTDEVASTLAIDTGIFKPNQFGTFLANHDMNRVMSQLAANIDKAKMGAVLLLTSPGVPFIYYGEEIGMLGKKPDESIRTPMQWSADKNSGFTTGTPWETVNPDYSDRNVSSETADPNSLLTLYRALIQTRNQHAALRVGDFQIIQSDNKAVFASLRISKDEAVMVLINLSKDVASDFSLSLAKSSLAAGTYHAAPIIGSSPQGVNDLSIVAGGFEAYQPLVSLPPYSYQIVQLQLSK